MLQILRKKAQSTFIQIIVVIIALVFIFWGVGTNLNRNRQAAITVNGEEISFQDFERAYNRAYERYSEQFGGNMPKGLAESLGIKQQVISQLVQTSLLRQGASRMGIYVSAEEVRKVIEGMVQFQENGVFSMERYKAVLANIRTAPTKFEKSMRIDKLSEVGAREIGNFAAIATDFEIEELYSRLNEKIKVNFVKFAPADFEAKVEVNDKALTEWFETVKDNYKTDPQIQLEYLTYLYDDVASKVEIDEPQIEKYYQENPEQFTTPEQRRAAHILFKTTATDSKEDQEKQAVKAEEVLAMAKEGKDFKTLAKEYSEGPSKDNGGELGFFSKGQMVPAFDEAVFSMKKGDISDVIKTQFGYHIILLEDIKPASTRSLDESKKQIISILQKKEAQSLAFQLANGAYESIISAGGLDQYRKTNPDSEIKISPMFAMDDAPADLKKDSIFITKAFELKKGEFSSLIKGNTGYAIFLVKDVKEPEIPPFDSIKEKITGDFKIARSKDLAKDAADKLIELAQASNLQAAAKEKNYVVEDSGEMGRNEEKHTSPFPEALLEPAFQLSKSEPLAKQAGQEGEDYYVYSFADRIIPKMDKDSKELEQLRATLMNFKQQQLLSAWLRHQELQAKITQHPSL